MQDLDYDILIIGGGVLGLAIAQEISHKKLRILVVERHDKFGRETSSRNSQVIHAGMYYPSNTEKAIHCVNGSKLLYEWCEKKNIPHKRIGKIIVAVNPEDELELDRIESQAKQNGVGELVRKTKSWILEREPNLSISSGLFSPNTGIIDSHKLMYSFQVEAMERQVDFAYSHELIEAEKNSGYYTLKLKDASGVLTQIKTRVVINSGGLDSDKIAQMVGLDIMQLKYNLHFCRGHYFRINYRKKNIVKHLIYPCPMKNLTGLGIHITVELDGGLRLGPDVLYLKENKQVYEIDSNLRDKFFKGVNQYIQGLSDEDIYPDTSGIRPKLQGPNEPFRDFIISDESKNGFANWINLIGIESPGLTSCLSIAKKVTSFI